jgi:phosphate:Na+ symporter
MMMSGHAQAAEGGQEIQWFFLIVGLLGGLSLFLYGMEQMGEALKEVAGEKMKDILGKLTTNPVMGLLTGLFVTAIIQSSSVTTVMLVGFVQADLMGLSQAIGVILGADIGTTVTAQIVAFKVTKFALLLVTIGFVMLFIGRTDRTKQFGRLIMGLGLIFFGMAVMSQTMKPLRSYEPFISLMQNVDNPMVGILVAAAFTGVVQSSSATMGVVVALASQGLISLEGGIALALGANIGTCATAGLAAIGKARKAVRVAVAHITFKILGVLMIVAFIPYLADFTRLISPTAPADLTGAQDILAAEVPRQVANAHTIFNVGLALFFLPLAGVFTRIIQRMVPDRVETAAEAAVASFQPKFLDNTMLLSPPMAISMVRREVARMGETVEEMLLAVPETVFKGRTDRMAEVRAMDDRVDSLYSAIASYLAKLGTHNLSGNSAGDAMTAMTVTTELENVGDIIETNMSHLTDICSSSNIQLGPQILEELTDYHSKLVKAFKASVVAFEHDNLDAAREVLGMGGELIEGMDKLQLDRQNQILQEDHTPQEMAAFTFETDVMENFKRIYHHLQRVAKLVLHQEGARQDLVVQ